MIHAQKKIDIIFFDAGSGHRSAAVGLQKVLQQQQPNWSIRCVNVVDIFDRHPRFGWIVRTGIDRFNRQIKQDKVFDLKGQINLSLLFHDLLSQKDYRQIAQFWSDGVPDAIVSVTPMYNPALYHSARLLNPQLQYITIPVDFEEVKPRYWFTPKIQQHYFNATDRLCQQAKSAGIPDEFNHRVPGMIIDPQCYEIPDIDKSQALVDLGLNPALPTGLVSFGGQGCNHSEDIAQSIAKANLKVNMIFLCGRNEIVLEQLNQLEIPYPKVVLGYLKETPIQYLHLADFAIGKPGTMTITESLITDTPLIIFQSRGMGPVQRGNEAWVIEHDVGKIVKYPHQVAAAIADLLSSSRYLQHSQIHGHRAVFDVAEKLIQLIEPSIHSNHLPYKIASTP
jgi:hypothetical protein